MTRQEQIKKLTKFANRKRVVTIEKGVSLKIRRDFECFLPQPVLRVYWGDFKFQVEVLESDIVVYAHQWSNESESFEATGEHRTIDCLEELALFMNDTLYPPKPQGGPPPLHTAHSVIKGWRENLSDWTAEDLQEIGHNIIAFVSRDAEVCQMIINSLEGDSSKLHIWRWIPSGYHKKYLDVLGRNIIKHVSKDPKAARSMTLKSITVEGKRENLILTVGPYNIYSEAFTVTYRDLDPDSSQIPQEDLLYFYQLPEGAKEWDEFLVNTEKTYKIDCAIVIESDFGIELQWHPASGTPEALQEIIESYGTDLDSITWKDSPMLDSVQELLDSEKEGDIFFWMSDIRARLGVNLAARRVSSAAVSSLMFAPSKKWQGFESEAIIFGSQPGSTKYFWSFPEA